MIKNLYNNINLHSIIKNYKQILKNAHIKTYSLDVEILIAYALEISREELLLNNFKEKTEEHYKKKLSEKELSKKESLLLSKIKSLMNQRLENKPISHIIGAKEFYSLNFIVNEHTLAPRPDTELLVDICIKHTIEKFKNHSENHSKNNLNSYQFNILDLGTGTGCIILSILHEIKVKYPIYYKQIHCVGVDINDATLNIAKINANNLNINNATTKVQFINSNWFSNLDNELNNELNDIHKYDIIVSNPPYINYKEWQTLTPEVKNYEPTIALTDYQNGLSHYETIINNAYKFMKKNSIIVLEIGYNQKNDICDIIKANNKFFQLLYCMKDIAGIDRALIIGRI